MQNPTNVTIDITFSAILKVLLFAIGVVFLWFIRDVVFAFIVAVILASFINPIADFAARYHLPRSITVLGVFIGLVGIVVLLITMLVPLIVEQGSSFIKNFSGLWEKVVGRAPFITDIASQFARTGESTTGSASLAPTISNAAVKLFSTVTNIIQGLFATVLTFVLAFYLAVQKNVMRQCIHFFTPTHYHEFAFNLIAKIQTRLRYWLQGQLALSLSIGVMVYIGLSIIGVPYALFLSVLAALLEIIPYVGPTLAALPPIFIVFASNDNGLLPALLTIGFFVIIQQIENHFLVPKIMQKAVGLNPVISIIAVAVGVKLAGIIGGLLAIPAMTAISVVIEVWQSHMPERIPS